jgi:hypothetical protein
MSAKINNPNKIKWFERKEPLKGENLVILKKIPFLLPKSFIDLLRISDGGEVDYNFSYYDEAFRDTIGSGISIIYGLGEDPYKYDLINAYNNPPEFFPKGLVPFGAPANSDRICFDYRRDPKTDNPPIVYWCAGSSEGEDVSFLANNFDEFLQILRAPEEE